jgi:hypothetical protein
MILAKDAELYLPESLQMAMRYRSISPSCSVGATLSEL